MCLQRTLVFLDVLELAYDDSDPASSSNVRDVGVLTSGLRLLGPARVSSSAKSMS